MIIIMSGQKRKNVSLTINEKCELKKYANEKKLKLQEYVEWVSKTFDKTIDRSTVGKILKAKIYVNVNSDANRIKPVKHPELDERLREWFLRFENKVCISDQMIKEKAKSLTQELGIPNGSLLFSDGWCHSFKNRYNIKRRNICGE